MSTQQTVSVERIQYLLKQLEEFNQLDLTKITLTENGEPIIIPDGIFNIWHFIGMSNQTFVESRFWEEDLEELREIERTIEDAT